MLFHHNIIGSSIKRREGTKAQQQIIEQSMMNWYGQPKTALLKVWFLLLFLAVIDRIKNCFSLE